MYKQAFQDNQALYSKNMQSLPAKHVELHSPSYHAPITKTNTAQKIKQTVICWKSFEKFLNYDTR